MNISPFNIPKILYGLQSQDNGEITYDVDHESFVLRLINIPSNASTLDLAHDMLQETRRIEKNMVQKLNCMFFVARRISMPTVEQMLKREKSEDYVAMYKGFSNQLNELINLYFSVMDENTIEDQIAGSAEERKIMMPLQYIDSARDKATIEGEIKSLLREYHEGGNNSNDAQDRMKPLDCVKVLMGIYSDRANVKRFMNDDHRLWKKYQEFDYEDMYKVANMTVN